MKLYEINQEINSLVDEETGEITDIARFQELLSLVNFDFLQYEHIMSYCFLKNS